MYPATRSEAGRPADRALSARRRAGSLMSPSALLIYVDVRGCIPV